MFILFALLRQFFKRLILYLLMKCEIQYLERVPENFPKNEVDSYRVEQSEDGWLYLRFDLQKWGLRGAESLASLRRGWIAPLYLNMSSSIFLLMTLMTLLPSSIGGLMGLWEEQAVMPLPIKGLELCDESPLFSCGGLSGYPYCPPNEGCSPEPMWER